MRVLIVENERKAADYLKKGLTENGFVVDTALQGEKGLYLALTRAYDLITLDVAPPRVDGWAILSELRRSGRQTPVLFVTACSSVHDRVRGLNLGADDYIVKPFAFSELLARVRAILRRGPSRKPDVLMLADMEIDPLRHAVKRSGRRIDLTTKEFLLLLLLSRHAGEALSRTFIAEQLWDMNFDGNTNVVDVAIRRLREKIDDPFKKRLIHTVRGIGYILEERR